MSSTTTSHALLILQRIAMPRNCFRTRRVLETAPTHCPRENRAQTRPLLGLRVFRPRVLLESSCKAYVQVRARGFLLIRGGVGWLCSCSCMPCLNSGLQLKFDYLLKIDCGEFECLTDDTVGDAAGLWSSPETEAKHGPISLWNTVPVTNMTSCKCLKH